jgi:hypothetical protein
MRKPGQARSWSTALLQKGSIGGGLSPAAFVLERAVPPVMTGDQVALGVVLFEVQILRAGARLFRRVSLRAWSGGTPSRCRNLSSVESIPAVSRMSANHP